MTAPSDQTMATDRQLTGNAVALRLDPLPIEPSTVLAGTPTASIQPLTELDGTQVGIWELTPGTVTDVESAEVFVVLSGRGTVTFEDGSAIDLGPGSVVRLVRGDRTTWTIAETLRKVYLA
jgi:uncharacterized cupin superfamily protein